MKEYIKIYKNFSSVKKYWNKIIKDNSDMTVYQTTEWNKHVSFTYRTNRYLLKTTRCAYYVLFKNGNPTIIAPVSIPKNKTEYISIKGQYSKAGSLNFIYSKNVTFEDFDKILNYIFKTTANDEIGLYEIPSYSKFHQYLTENPNARFLFGELCVHCSIPKQYEDYYNALSKSARQTIRTSYNRLVSDNKSFSVEFYQNGNNISISDLPQIKHLCYQREEELNGREPINTPPTKMNLITFLSVIRDTLYRFTLKEKESFVVTLKIDDSLAAVMLAAKKDGYVIVPTFAHDSSFDRYSPGVILLNEFFKEFCGSELNCLDLSRGNEKYKYKYLCNPNEYNANHFKIKRPE